MIWKGAVLSKPPYRKNLETQLLQAHVKLRLASKHGHGLVTATLARHGSYEVRMYEPPHDEFLFWIELFDHNIQFSIDSYGRHVLEDAVVAADDLIAQAKACSEQLAAAQIA